FRKITTAEGKRRSVTREDDREPHADQCSRAGRPHTVSTGYSGEDPVGPGLATAPALLVLRGPLGRARAAGPGHRPHPRRRLAHGARRPVEPPVLRHIQDDIGIVTSLTLDLLTGVINSRATLGSFVVMLWLRSGTLPLRLPGVSVAIPGYMLDPPRRPGADRDQLRPSTRSSGFV